MQSIIRCLVLGTHPSPLVTQSVKKEKHSASVLLELVNLNKLSHYKYQLYEI